MYLYKIKKKKKLKTIGRPKKIFIDKIREDMGGKEPNSIKPKTEKHGRNFQIMSTNSSVGKEEVYSIVLLCKTRIVSRLAVFLL